MARGGPPVTLSGETMGTTYTVKLARLPDGVTADDLKREIDRRLEVVNAQMSTWRPESELSQFNRYQGRDWFPVSADTAKVVAAARQMSEASGGAFDATVLPLVDLWSFGPAGRPQVIPTAAELAAAREHVGYAHVEVRHDPSALRKLNPAVQLDLSAIAKGYGVDVIADYLTTSLSESRGGGIAPENTAGVDRASLGAPPRSAGGTDGYLVEIGGEVRASGTKPDGTPWQVGIETPRADRRGIQRIVLLRDRALATSGDYRHFFVENGRRFSHTIDPRTGRPVAHRLASVSVFAETCMEADALATALMVLGEDEGYNWAVAQGLVALFLVHDGDGFVERPTPAFSREFPEPAHAREPRSAVETFVLTIAIFLGAVLLMAIGAFFGRRIRGSCGGLAGLRDEQGNVLCDACRSPSPTCGSVAEGRRRSDEEPHT